MASPAYPNRFLFPWPYAFACKNNGCPGNVELQDVWMPRPKWSVGGRFNSDGSGGTTPNSYTEFGFVRMAFEGTTRATIDYVNSANGKVIDTFVLEH